MKQIYIIIQITLCAAFVRGQDSNTTRKVMTWVPPYAVSACQETLRKSFDRAGMSNGITHLGLQFWTPTMGGGIERVTKYGAISDSQISDLQTWAANNDIHVMLCIYNGISGWNWELAVAAFDANKKNFIDALMKETLRLNLDGIDIDLEGIGHLKSSKAAFITFIKDLSDRLHARGKVLTVDTFPYKWNAPNSTWWPELLPIIDGLNVMGYTETGEGAADWRAYAALKKAAGIHADKLLIGMPSNKADWQESSIEEHLNWVVKDSSVGLAIWDAQLKDPAWRTKEVWGNISKIRGTD
jgi:hypothetical protein